MQFYGIIEKSDKNGLCYIGSDHFGLHTQGYGRQDAFEMFEDAACGLLEVTPKELGIKFIYITETNFVFEFSKDKKIQTAILKRLSQYN